MDAELLSDFLRRAQDGDESALRVVFDATYPELRTHALARLRRGSRNTLLDTTSLVHETFLRFASSGRLTLSDCRHFMRYASHVMRSVIVGFVREWRAQRRGGGAQHVTLHSEIREGAASADEDDILGVHDALEELAKVD